MPRKRDERRRQNAGIGKEGLRWTKAELRFSVVIGQAVEVVGWEHEGLKACAGDPQFP